MTGDPTAGGRYMLRAFLKGAQVNEPRLGWDDLADALFLAMELAEDGRGADSSWVITDTVTGADIVRVDIAARVTYLA